MTKINKNGVLVDMTDQEETEFAQTLADGAAAAEAKIAYEANVASTKSKLEALGLTIDEIKDAFNI